MNTKSQEQPLNAALITGNFTITATMPNDKTINVAGYLYEGESIQSVNQRVSLFQDIVDFQRTKAEIPKLEVELDVSIRRIADMQAHYGVLVAKKEKGGKMSVQEKQALEVMDVNVKHHFENVEKGRAAIAEAKAKVEAGLK